MRTLVVLLLGALVGAATLGAIWATHGSEAQELEVRVSVERLLDGRVEIGLQQRGGNGEWDETQRPQYRFLAPNAAPGAVRYSSPVTFDLVTRAERITEAYRAQLTDAGRWMGHYYVRRFHADDDPETLRPVLCLVDPNESIAGAICGGIGETFPAGVDVITSNDYNAIADELERRLLAGEVSQVMATSYQILETAALARDHILLNNPELPWTWIHYWFDPVDPQLPGDDDLFCVVSHGGGDLFWGLASETATFAAAALGINLRAASFSDVSDQDELAPAINEATAAGIPVLSFNSGAEAAAQVGTSFHIGLNDRRAGEIAGEQFNREGTEGTILCVIHEANNVGLRDRCAGLASTYANGDVEIQISTAREAADAVLERYAKGDIAAVMALSDTVGVRILRAQWPDPQIPLATFGFNLGFAKWVEEGKIMFAIYDHPLVQSYLGVMGALLIDRMKLDPVTFFNGMTLLIDPQIADAEQMRRVTSALIPEEIQDRYLSEGADGNEELE